MALRIGIDIVHIPRMAALTSIAKATALERMFHKVELTNKDPSHLAGILAVKESVFKALGKPPCWLDVTVESSASGKPAVSISPACKHASKASIVDVSISHDGDYAIAMVLLEK